MQLRNNTQFREFRIYSSKLNPKFDWFGLVILTCRLKAIEGYFGTDLVNLNRGQRTRSTSELAISSPNFRTTPAGGRLAPTYDLTCNRPNTRRIFSGIGFRIWSPTAPRPTPYH
ncbi:hypothetical protein AVEN_249819-1 [Araneus ventricosus]|uniref:Uncharacterized protein n=1 Tax=Araneus ventricosus TaxID=182803 RepID=A0A4Y2LMZ5_ARAVE|nr:hypothetical protein AVEN_249819-1 [Araneus ventricosus]